MIIFRALPVMIFSSPEQYAIRAMAFLGQQEPGKLSSIREISEAADIPLPYLAKIINRLVRARLVRARRGPAGGVMLGKAASSISIGEIVEVLGGRNAGETCVLGLAECSDRNPCPVHESWKSVREVLLEQLHHQTIGDLLHTESKRPRPKRRK